MRTPHTTVTKGKRVRVVLHDGSVIVGKFTERLSRFVVVDGNRIAVDRIRAFSLLRRAEAAA
jgi:hypothetical protein